MSITLDYVQCFPSVSSFEGWNPVDLLLSIPIIGTIISAILNRSSDTPKDPLKQKEITLSTSSSSSVTNQVARNSFSGASSSPFFLNLPDPSLEPNCSLSTPSTPREEDPSFQPDCSISSPPSPRTPAVESKRESDNEISRLHSLEKCIKAYQETLEK